MINQYYPKRIQLPQPGEIREITDRRTGKVQHLGRVTRINSHNRMAEIELLDLDRNGRERTK
jgi:hypothetical protein